MTQLLTEEQVYSLFPKRNEESNKGDFGYITLIGGCVKYSGAIRLAQLANSAMRAGAGVCTIAAPKSLTDLILPQILESTFFPLSDEDGEIFFFAPEFDQLIERSDVIAFGMGIGNSAETRKALKYLLKNYEGILIVDADGINAMAKLDRKLVKEHKCKLIVTPHPKEFSRLAKMKLNDVLKHGEESAEKLAKELNAIVLLKGHASLITDGSEGYLVQKGGAGMATAGSGDVLSGIIAAMLACNTDKLLLATAGAAYVNGLAGEIAEAENGDVSMLAGDTARSVQKAIKQIRENNAPKEEPEAPEEAEQAKPTAKKILGTILMIILLIAAGVYTLYTVDIEKRDARILAQELYDKSDHREAQEEYEISLGFLYKDIYIDGILVNNYQLYRPFGMYESSTYVPLTSEVCDALGIACSWDSSSITDVYITKAKASHGGIFYDVYGWNPFDITGRAKANVTIHIGEGEDEEKLFPNEYETVSYNDGETMYIPLSMLLKSETLDISAYYDMESGLYISTDPEIPAESYYSENNASYIAGRVAYIQSHQSQLGIDTLRYYEYIFRHEATVMDVDEDLLLTVARTESRFNAKDRSAAGAKGIMQIMPDTAKAQGINPDDLYDVHICVQFGAAYLRNAIKNFKGDLVKALSVYNFGGNAVLSGAYDTNYADTVISRMETMEQWYKDNGYSSEFYTVLECTK